MSEPKLGGLVPDTLRVRSARILLESLEVQADIGFHEFEVGAPQRLLVTVEIWLDDARHPSTTILHARGTTISCAPRSRRSRPLAASICRRRWPMRFSSGSRPSAAFSALRVRTSKPDIYPDAHGVGVEIASFDGLWPDRLTKALRQQWFHAFRHVEQNPLRGL